MLEVPLKEIAGNTVITAEGLGVSSLFSGGNLIDPAADALQKMLNLDISTLISALVEEGNAEGVFHAEYPRETTEMLILYAGTAFDSRLEPTPEQLQARAQALIRNTEKLLGVEAGSLAGPMARLFQQMK